MASDKDSPGSPRQTGGGRRKRPVEPRPIELEATELRDEVPRQTELPEGQQPEAVEPPHENPPTGETSLLQKPQDEAAAAEQADKSQVSENKVEEKFSEPTSTDEATGAEGSGASDTADLHPAAARQQSRFASLFVAGVCGGLVVLLLMFGLGVAGIWPPAEDAALRAELAQAQSRISALEEAEPELPPAADPEAVEALAGRMEALEAQFEEGVEAPDLSDVEVRLSALEEATGDAATTEEVDQALAEIGERVDELAGALSGLAEGIGPDPQIAERMSQLEAAFAEERGTREAMVSRLERLEERLAETALESDQQLVRAAAGAIALTGLARAVEAGRPFQSELAAIEPVIDDPQAIETLAARAEDGLPTIEALSEDFADRVTAILGAGEDPGEAPGFLSRLTETAGALVRVRPAEPMEGDSRTAIVSRIEAALAAGNLDAAHEEWQHLDPPAQQASAQWAAVLAERRAAENELEMLFARMTAALGQRADSAE